MMFSPWQRAPESIILGRLPGSRSHQEMKIGKKSCVIPTTLESNVVQLHTFLYDQEQYDAPSSVKRKSAITLPRKPALESLARIRNLARMSARKAIMVEEDRPEERQNSLLQPGPDRTGCGKKAAHLWRSLPKQKRRPSKALQQKKLRKPKPPPASSVRRRTTRVPLRQPLPITPVMGRGPSAGPGSSNGPGTSNAPTAAETNAALEALGTEFRQRGRRSRTGV